MKPLNTIAVLTLAITLLTPLPNLADEGHDHGAAPESSGPSAPRFVASSELFELVGIVQGNEIVMYLDRYADNSPVSGAQIELELNGVKVAVKPEGDGEYHAELPKDLKGGTVTIAANVTAGKDIDVLATDLHMDNGHAAEATVASGWKRPLVWSASILAALIVLLLGARMAKGRRMEGAA